MNSIPVKGFAIFCDDIGMILEVPKDTIFNSGQTLVGKFFQTLVIHEKRQLLYDFLLEIKQRGMAFGFEISLEINHINSSLSPIGIMIENKLLIIGSESQNDSLDFLNEMQIINNEQSNTIRYLIKSQSGGFIKERSQTQLLNEVTLLNNEILNVQRELARKNEELARLNELKNRFLGMAAHDLRNPLAIIECYASFLIEEDTGTLSEAQLHFLSNINESAKFSLSIIEHLLDISKIESGKLELRLSEFEFMDLLSHNIELNRIFASRKHISIAIETEEKSIKIKADEQKLKQVFNNLITNAAKFSFPGSQILVTVRVENRNLIVVVSDAGQGIEPEKMDKIFLPFEKGTASGTSGEKGAGLGLAIVKRIVEGHKGKIWVESEVGKRTDFYVSLPLV